MMVMMGWKWNVVERNEMRCDAMGCEWELLLRFVNFCFAALLFVRSLKDRRGSGRKGMGDGLVAAFWEFLFCLRCFLCASAALFYISYASQTMGGLLFVTVHSTYSMSL